MINYSFRRKLQCRYDRYAYDTNIANCSLLSCIKTCSTKNLIAYDKLYRVVRGIYADRFTSPYRRTYFFLVFPGQLSAIFEEGKKVETFNERCSRKCLNLRCCLCTEYRWCCRIDEIICYFQKRSPPRPIQSIYLAFLQVSNPITDFDRYDVIPFST